MATRKKQSVKRKSTVTKQPAAPRITQPAEEFARTVKGALTQDALSRSDFQTLCAKAKITSTVLVIGEDRHRIRRLLNWLKKHLTEDTAAGERSPPRPRWSVYFSSELASASSIQPLVQAIRTPSLFSTAQVIVIQDIEALRANVAQLLASAIASALPSTLIVLTSVKDEAKGPLLTELRSPLTIVQVHELNTAQLIRSIERELRENGIEGGIEHGAAKLLVDTFGSDTGAIFSELTKVSLMVDPAVGITEELMKSVLTQSPEKTSFDLIQEIGRKNLPGSIALVSQLLRQGVQPLQLVYFLSRGIRTLITLNEENSRFKGKETIPLHWELTNAWFRRGISPVAKLFSFRELTGALRLLTTLDLKLKSSKLSDSVLLVSTVQRLCLREF